MKIKDITDIKEWLKCLNMNRNISLFLKSYRNRVMKEQNSDVIQKIGLIDSTLDLKERHKLIFQFWLLFDVIMNCELN